jgi:hypothetical protein
MGSIGQMIEAERDRQDYLAVRMMISRPAMPRPFVRLPSVDDSAFSRMVKSINPEWIEEALTGTGTATIRRRRLPAEQVVWLALGMALYRGLPITEVVAKLDLALPAKNGKDAARSAVCQARARVGDEPLKWLFERCAEEWGHASARRYGWRGLAVYGVDGTTVRVPDSKENRAHFGGISADAARGPSGYPLARIVTLMALRSHILAAANFGPYAAEQVYAQPLWELVPNDALAIVDRGFLDAKILIPLARDPERNRHWLTRAKSTTRRHRAERFGKGDELVILDVSSAARKQDPTLPMTWTVRAITYQRRGFRPQILLTSLIDPKKYPAREIIALYHERWELELGYDEVKTEMLEREETLRSKKPEGVAQELWAVGLAYNLIRLEMERVAEEAGVPPTRISFIAALHLLRTEWAWLAMSDTPGSFPKRLRRLREDLGRFVLPARRPNRSFPRAVKLKMSPYARKRPTTTQARRAK